MKRLIAALRLGIAGIAGIASLVGSTPARAEAPAQGQAAPVEGVHWAPLPDNAFGYREVVPYPTFAWVFLQLLPSPELAFGRARKIDINGAVDKTVPTAWGLRWQLTPLLWSFGVHRSQTRWRTFVVDPLARQSGSVELSTSFEYIGDHVDRMIARPGLRVYLPLAQRGENLSMSLGTSVYSFEGLRVAYDAGVYVMSGFLGLVVTVAPTHDPLAAIATIQLRYF